VRLTNSQANGRAVADDAPGSRRARRRPSDTKLEAVTGKKRDESAPPTKPSIAPPSGSPERNTERSALRAEAPLDQLVWAAPTRQYGVVIALAGATLGASALVAAWAGGGQQTWLSSTLWFLAADTFLFGVAMTGLISFSFTRRVRVLAQAAERLTTPGQAVVGSRDDAVTSLARSVGQMSERIAELTAEIESCVQEEQGRVDALVRERTRALARENEDLRRVLGESKQLLSLDRDGKLLGPVSPRLVSWLGAAPPAARLWDYFEQASHGAGSRFAAAWANVIGSGPREPSLKLLPKSLAVDARYLALEYKAVHDAAGNLERVLVMLSDITIPEPDPATPS
jgi:hypothetical protein